MDKIRSYTTPRGAIFLEGPVSGEKLESMDMNLKLNIFRPSLKQKKALINITRLPNGMVYIARHNNEIVGYITFHQPDEYSRWINHPRVIEMGAIEVSADWRNYKIAKNLLAFAFSNPFLDDYITITMEYCWHWDLEETGLGIWDYQRTLTRLFGYVGLVVVPTDDPDINDHPANVLMARFGKNISREDKKIFENMAYMDKFQSKANLI